MNDKVPAKEDSETPSEEFPESENDQSNWAHDQQNRSYYYDDSTGYEIYNPDEEEDED